MAAASSMETLGLPINQSTAFTDHRGVFKERLRKRQLKMLQAYVPVLTQHLEPGEEVLLAMRGCSPMSFLEQLTTGWIIHYIKRCMLVVTERRILHFPSKGNYAPRDSVSQMRFGDVQEIRPSSFFGRRFTVEYKGGKKETFLYVQDMQKFKSVLCGISLAGQQPTSFGERHHLCPRCTEPLTVGEYLCPSCRLAFKTEQRARTLSMLLPGGGYFYTGHPVLGLGDAIVETALLFLLLAGLLGMMTGARGSGAVFEVVFTGFLLLLEKAITVFHATHYVREFLPLERGVEPLRRRRS